MEPNIPVLRSRLLAAQMEVLDVRDSGLTAMRRRTLPNRGLFRLLIPRVVCNIRVQGNAVSPSVRPDGLAIGIVIVCLGGLLTEFTMDRAKYPREYPPEFIYGLTAFYLVLLVLELVKSRQALARALGPGGQ